jgi:predicted DNA-binding protein (UPF0251 family)
MAKDTARFTKITTDLMIGVRDLAKWGIETGNTSEEKLRLTVAARKETAVKLIESGMSQRQAAKVLGVSYTTIQKDVTTKVSKSDNKVVTGSAKTKAKKSNGKVAVSGCDYDWSNPDPKDFGDPSEMYRKQAENYRDEALHFAKAYPLLSTKVTSKVITKTEINAAQKVVEAWMEVVSKLTAIISKE